MEIVLGLGQNLLGIGREFIIELANILTRTIRFFRSARLHGHRLGRGEFLGQRRLKLQINLSPRRLNSAARFWHGGRLTCRLCLGKIVRHRSERVI